MAWIFFFGLRAQQLHSCTRPVNTPKGPASRDAERTGINTLADVGKKGVWFQRQLGGIFIGGREFRALHDTQYVAAGIPGLSRTDRGAPTGVSDATVHPSRTCRPLSICYRVPRRNTCRLAHLRMCAKPLDSCDLRCGSSLGSRFEGMSLCSRHVTPTMAAVLLGLRRLSETFF